MRHVKYVLSATIAAAIVTGCVRENTKDCHTTLIFSYKGDGDKEIFADKIAHVDLYVFDDDHNVVLDHHHPTDAELSAQRMKVFIPTGRQYRVVAVANMQVCQVRDLYKGRSAETRIMHPGHHEISNGRGRIDNHSHLYMGNENVVVPSYAGSTHVVNFRASHIDMWVEVAGYDDYAAQHGDLELELEHSGLPGWTDFSNNCILPPDQWVSYYPQARRQGNLRIHEYNVMRDIRGSTIHLRDSSGEVFSLDVERFVQDHLMSDPRLSGPYNARGELLQEAFIPIRIEFKSVGAEVSIPDWVLEDVIPEF